MGIGIHQLMMNRIFEPLFLQPNIRAICITVLVSACLLLTRMFKITMGTIEVRSEVDKGATFILTLPSDQSLGA